MRSVCSEIEWSARESMPKGISDETALIEVFRNAYETHVGPIFRWIYRYVGNREEAEDLTAQVFTKALNKTNWTREQPVIRRWLLQIARTTVADYWREHYKMPTSSLDMLLETGWEEPAAASFQSEFEEYIGEESPSTHLQTINRDNILAKLACLQQNYYDVLHYRFLQNYSIKETAEAMSITEANAKVLQYRALKKMAELCQQHTHDPSDQPMSGVIDAVSPKVVRFDG